MAYLVDHPPRRSQYRHPRRATPTGCICLHSAENVPDLNPPDTGAEAVANFIKNRPDPGSYHDISDNDSSIHLVNYADEAFGDGTGSNPWAIHNAGAFRAHQWSTLPEDWKAGVVENMARAAVRADAWLQDVHGVTVPAVQLTREESEAGRAGFITHAQRDPARRSDPGAECARLVVLRYAQLTLEEDMPTPEEVARATVDLLNKEGTAVGLQGFGATVQHAVELGRRVDVRTTQILTLVSDPAALAAAIVDKLPAGSVAASTVEAALRKVFADAAED